MGSSRMPTTWAPTTSQLCGGTANAECPDEQEVLCDAPILTITPSPTVDLTAEVAELVLHRKLRAHISAFQPGGGGVNVSRVLHDLGTETTAVVTVGGLPGETVVDGLGALGIPNVAVPTVAETRWAEMLRERSTNIEYRLIAETAPLAEEEWWACVHELAAVARGRDLPFLVDTSGHALAAAVDARGWTSSNQVVASSRPSWHSRLRSERTRPVTQSVKW